MLGKLWIKKPKSLFMEEDTPVEVPKKYVYTYDLIISYMDNTEYVFNKSLTRRALFEATEFLPSPGCDSVYDMNSGTLYRLNHAKSIRITNFSRIEVPV